MVRPVIMKRSRRFTSLLFPPRFPPCFSSRRLRFLFRLQLRLHLPLRLSSSSSSFCAVAASSTSLLLLLLLLFLHFASCSFGFFVLLLLLLLVLVLLLVFFAHCWQRDNEVGEDCGDRLLRLYDYETANRTTAKQQQQH